MTNTVNQEGNVVGRDQAGRDVIHNITHNYAVDPTKPTYMHSLIEKFKKEREFDKKFNDIVEKLRHYWTPVEGESIIGLEEKLKAGGYEHLIPFAKQTKELFVKKLVKYQFSETAQTIHAYLLAEIYSRFHIHISPLIHSGISQEKINDAIQLKIIDPFREILEENVLELYADEINGMLYFLTGNCHIKWVK